MSLIVWVEIAAVLLAAWAVYRTLPRPPRLDWERLLKVSLSTVLRGALEAEDKDFEDWQAAVSDLVPYHPAGRDPEAKLRQPDPAALPTPALDGERALVEALAALPDPPARWKRLYADPNQIELSLLIDPASLGDDYRAEAFFGADVSWEDVAAWSDAARAGLQRRLSHVIVAGGPLAVTLAEQAGLRSLATLDEGALEAGRAQASDRLVLVLEGDAVLPALQRLHDDAQLRDWVLAVIAVGGDICESEAAAAWVAAHFNHDELDTELNRSTPYAALPVVDPADLGAVDWSGQRWPVPPELPSGRAPIQAVDLGPVPPQWLGSDERRVQLSRALWVVIAGWLS